MMESQLPLPSLDGHRPTQEEVDEILRKKRKFRGGKACYPCAKRKVKCDSSVRVVRLSNIFVIRAAY